MSKLEGTLVCFVSIMGLTFLLGRIPVVIGFPAALFLGGLIGGLVARGVEDGIIAGFVGGLLGSITSSILLIVFLSAIFPTWTHLKWLLVLMSVPFALISCMGGAVGGAINKEVPSRRYVSPPPPAAPPKPPLSQPPTALPTQNFCPGCGAELQPDAIYCGNCGKKLR